MITSRVIVAALLSGFAAALPHRIRDSSINEPAVEAPNGTPITEGTPPAATSVSYGSSGSSYGSSMSSGSYSGYGSSMNSDSYSGYGSSMDSGYSGDSYSSSSDMSYDDMSTSVMMDTTSSTMMMDSTSTSVAWNSYQTPTYGSGSSNWGSYNQGSNYNDCVSQCVAQYGNAPQPWTPPPTQTSSDSGSSSGSGATHTVYVAPTPGLLRYFPAFLNATPGDTVRFVWGADNHTVTKSSELTPCNKTSDSPFTSGVQLTGFTFDQVVNSTDPTFFYCGVPTHCQKGMFGIINPPFAAGANTSVALMMSNMTATDPNLSAYSSIVSNMTQNDMTANTWGGNMDLAQLPEWSHTLIADNVMYTRMFLATNPTVLQQNGTFDFTQPDVKFPMDISNALSSTSPDAVSSPSSPSATSAGTSAASGTPSSAAASTTPNGAAAVSPKFAVALAAAAASFFLL